MILSRDSAFSTSVQGAGAYSTSCPEKCLQPRVVAMDRGLVVCKRWGYKPRSIAVYNPIAKNQWKELPRAPVHWSSGSSSVVNLVVDSIARNFMIFLTKTYFKARDLECFSSEERLKILNDPITNEWKGSTTPSCIFEFGPTSSVIHQECLYVLFSSYQTFECQLWRYNHLGDSWEELHFDPTGKPLYSGLLIVSANRLFLVVVFYDYHTRRDFEFCEVNILPDMSSLETLLTSREEFLRRDEDFLKCHWTSGTDVIGFDNSLMFISKRVAGEIMAFDLVTRSWDRQWSQNPFGHPRYRNCSWVGKQMNFLLPGTLW